VTDPNLHTPEEQEMTELESEVLAEQERRIHERIANLPTPSADTPEMKDSDWPQRLAVYLFDIDGYDALMPSQRQVCDDAAEWARQRVSEAEAKRFSSPDIPLAELLDRYFQSVVEDLDMPFSRFQLARALRNDRNQQADSCAGSNDSRSATSRYFRHHPVSKAQCQAIADAAAARQALVEYIEQRTLTAEEAAEILEGITKRSTRDKLRLISATTEIEK
jgi:hypothetical protein